ncbi:MAG: hypothetical protein MI806_17455, partial [Minwuiales bacterium]|nr:hypothetical protein [Minwuiales bacterium]
MKTLPLLAICAAVALGASEAWGRDAGAEASFAAPEDGGPRRWQVSARDGIEMQASPAPDARAIAKLADGAILANLGCAPAGGRVWCKVRPLRGRARGYVMADFLGPARGPDGTVPMGADDSA